MVTIRHLVADAVVDPLGRVGAIDVPVGLRYDHQDRFVPMSASRYLERPGPTAEAHFYPDYGHIPVVGENEPAIVEWLRR